MPGRQLVRMSLFKTLRAIVLSSQLMELAASRTPTDPSRWRLPVSARLRASQLRLPCSGLHDAPVP